MACDGLVRSAGATRIPIQFVANSASSRRNKQLEGRDPDQQPRRYDDERHEHRHQPQQQQTMTSAGDNHTPSINGRVTSPPPPPLSPPRHVADSAERLPRHRESGGLRSHTDVRPLTVSCRPDRDHRSRQRARPSDERATRTRVQSDSRPTPVASFSGRDSLRRSLVTLTGRPGGSYSSGDDSGDDVISQTRSTSTHCTGQSSHPEGQGSRGPHSQVCPCASPNAA